MRMIRVNIKPDTKIPVKLVTLPNTIVLPDVDYGNLKHIPKINGVEVKGNKTSDDFGIGIVTDHDKLTGRDKPDQHPISAITELEEILEQLRTQTGGASEYANAIMAANGDCAVYVNASDGVSVIDKVKNSGQRGLFTLYVQKGCVDNPRHSEEIKSSLRGICHVTFTKQEYGYMYAWFLLVDQSGTMYSRYVRALSDGEWVEHRAASESGANGIPKVTDEDNGKVLTVKNGVWSAEELPKYDGEYTVTPSASDDKTLLTAGKTMTKNLKVEKIPFSEVTNTQGGTTVNIG